ncbi:ROK family protein [Psychromarinibacter halotolerans]|uniref:ROK family protein n=1 Tax=Psychromarinibacter halotolerans TaxID=1775175 RepID=A0ABV7GNX2_9RHOB|nr:ROK family protein [Psychromarinibacter halotolerans]MDF0596833.1 ROK family protein [Psychromarinibacter halotolerans]
MSAALAIDIGGTKVLCALVEDGVVLDHAVAETARGSGPAAWLETAASLAAGWTGRYQRLGLAVTGRVSATGRWSALNPGTLNIPDNTPLTDLAADKFGVPALAVNDAQAAAWGEYRYGAGRGEDLVYLTVSTGIGGGIVSGGQLLRGRGGIAGHFGQMRIGGRNGARLESRMAGRWLTEAADAAGHPADARGVFEAAKRGEAWAQDLRDTAERRVAELTGDVQLTLDPVRIVMGGGIGLSDGFIDNVAAHHAALPPALRPALVPAQLGVLAGAVGAAALADDFSSN